jgi:hypothetical protein
MHTQQPKRSNALAIVHPSSGEELVIEPEKWRQTGAAIPGSDESIHSRAHQVLPKRSRNVLDIVDPRTVEESPMIQRQDSEARAASRRSSTSPLLMGSFDYLKAVDSSDSLVPTDDVGSTVFQSLLTAFEEPSDRVVMEAQRVPTIAAMSEYDNDTEVAKDPIAKTRKWSRHLRLQQSPVNGSEMIEALPAKTIQEADTSGADRSPESPASSLGSDCASSTASAAVVGMGRSFPKPSKVKRDSRDSPTYDPWNGSNTDLLWALKSEASRGKFKRANSGLLGVTITQGPRPDAGFGAGRGGPLLKLIPST